MIEEKNKYDVIICGGGLAGLTLARQLTVELPELSILMVDRLSRPLPEAAFKVGESTVVIGAHYLEHVLKLGNYLSKNHFEKLGLRFFFSGGKASESFFRRPEMGRSIYNPLATEWQIDRGVFENDLREIVISDGVDMIESSRVKDMVINDAEEDNSVIVNVNGKDECFSAPWVVDATGRRKFLQRKLGLERDSLFSGRSAAWFRIKGIVDVSKLVNSENVEWHKRVPGANPKDPTYNRWNSTSHLVGDGYWVWLIPLASGHTSIGIVSLEDIQSFSSYGSRDKARLWLSQNEADLYGLIEHSDFLDFKMLRNYSHSCSQVLSSNKWAITGDAGIFPDPLYSPGIDSISYTNRMISELISLDRSSGISSELCDILSRDYIEWLDKVVATTHTSYQFFGDSVVSSMKIVWDFMNSIWFNGPKFFSMIFKPGFALNTIEWDGEFKNIRPEFERLSELNSVIINLFKEWKSYPNRSASFKWLDYFQDLTFLRDDLIHCSTPKESPFIDLDSSFKRIEMLAISIFYIALEDTMPDQLHKFEEDGRGEWINAWSLSLNERDWEKSGLFKPTTKPQNITQMRKELRKAFQFSSIAIAEEA
ncbi:MAG: tryptophan 7-halogenase [Colwellia sp.]